MPSYLDRYRQGECEQVWAELLAQGGGIRQQPLYDEALAVTRETMKRARTNIELLVPRLKTLGYEFAFADRAFVPADEDFRQTVANVERRAGPLPLSLRIWCEEVGEVNFMGSHPKLSTYVNMPEGKEIAANFLTLFAKYGGSVAGTEGDPLRQSVGIAQGLLNQVMQGMRLGLPRSPEVQAGAQASKELLESFQRPMPIPGPDVDSDPLVVEPYFQDQEEDMEGDDDMEGADQTGPFEAMIAPDPIHKTNHIGGDPYCIQFPDPAIDATLRGDEDYGTFVEYLRICFRWGGFPGLRTAVTPPREELDYLINGLSPL
jgi:hypothetical protein